MTKTRSSAKETLQQALLPVWDTEAKKGGDTEPKKRGRPRKYGGIMTAQLYARVTEDQRNEFEQMALKDGYENPSEAMRDLVLSAIRRGRIE